MSNTNDLDQDSLSRKRIVSETNANFFVEAGAGSGKTTMLVNRMVAMVEAGTPIEKICAITFTKAAAGEFYSRFQKLLVERSNPNCVWEDDDRPGQLRKPDENSMKLCAEALKKIDLCFMGTIDSFCSMVLSEHPSEAQIPSDANIISEQDAEDVFKQEYVKICDEKYGPELAALARTFQVFHRNAEQVFVQGVSFMMNNRNVQFHYTEIPATDLDDAFASEKKMLVKAVKFLVKNQDLKYDGNACSREAWEKIEDISISLQKKWSRNFSNVMYALKPLFNIRLSVGAQGVIPAELAGMFERQGQRGGWLVLIDSGLLQKLQNLCYSASMTFLGACVPVLETALREKGKMTFFDYLYYLREMLRKDAAGDGKLIRYIYNRHSYFLIDEFQDTNPMQAEVFFYLASEHPVEKWSDCVPRPGSLFIVGDPKQSIYRFRSADVASFLKVKCLFKENVGSVLTLSKNFRSTRLMCDYFNRVFSAMLPSETSDQSKFENIPLSDAADDKADEFQGVFAYTAWTGKTLEAQHPNESDPAQIAKIIDRLVGNEKFLIRSKDGKELRQLRYSDIMIITFGKSRLGPIMKALDEKNIPAKVEGAVSFGENEALLETAKIYAALADDDDAIALFGALTGNLIGLTERDVLKFKECGGKVSLKSSFEKEGADTDACLVASKIDELKNLRSVALRLSPAALFAKILDDYKVYEHVKSENLEVVYYTLELMRNAERSGLVVSLKDGADYLYKLINGKSGEERCLSLNDKRDAVHIANLHKVKGLEAPVVILAAAAKTSFSNDVRVEHGDNSSDGYLFSVSPKGDSEKKNVKYFETKEFSEKLEKEKQASDEENKRLIYVAATRARNALIICDRIQATSKGGESHKSKWEPLMENASENEIKDFFECTEETEKVAITSDSVDSISLYDKAEESSVLKNRKSEKATYSIETPSHLHLPSKMSESQEHVADEAPKATEEPQNDQLSVVHRHPQELGTMTHKLMEMLVSAKDKIEASEAVNEILNEFLTPECEKFRDDFKAALSGVAERMRNGGYAQSNGLPQDMLKTLLDADEVYCEVPFCYSEESENGKAVWNGIMDVVYLANGAWHIVDYKTNADGNDLDKRYELQLAAYIKAFKKTTGNDADAFTYHIDI